GGGKKDAKDPENEDNEASSTEEPRVNQEKDHVNNTNRVNVVSSTVNAVSNQVNVINRKLSIELPGDLDMPELEDISIFKDPNEDVFGVEADLNNLESTFQVSPILITRIHKDHPLQQVIGDWHSAPQTRRMLKNLEMHVNNAFLYAKIEEEAYVCQPHGFEDCDFPDRVYKVERVLYGLHQASRAWYETLSTYLLDNRFQRGMIGKTFFIKGTKVIFRELTFFLGLQVKQKEDGIFINQDKYVNEILTKFGFSDVKTASTPLETHKTLLKDEKSKDADEHLYRSMIGLLMYLTSSRPDIMFVVCAYVRFQVNPKISHLHAVKMIFRYLKGQLKLGLWYPKDSPFDLVAYTDSDYVGATLDRKSTTKGCQFLWCRIISWQCKKKSVTKIHIDNESTICIVKNLVFHSKTKHIEIRHHFIRDSNEKKLIQMIKIHTNNNVADLLTKAFDPTESAGFEQIIDFMNAHPIKYALTVNLTIYTSCVEQFWVTTKVKNINGEAQLHSKTVADEAVNEEMYDSLEMATTTAANLDAEQDRGNIIKTQSKATPLGTPLLRLETTKIVQAKEIANLKKRVKRLERKTKSRSHGLKRLYKVGLSARMESSADEESLGEKDASKQRRISDIDANQDIYLVNGEEVNASSIATATTTTPATTPTIYMDEITLAKALIEIKTSRPKAKGLVMQEPSETPRPTPIICSQQPSKVQDKGKGIMVEPDMPLKKKSQISLDEKLAFKLQAEEDEQERIVREKAQQIEEKRRKFFDAKKAKEKRNKPPTKAQQRSLMCTNLKNMDGWRTRALKNKSFAKIQDLFDKAMKMVNMFVDIDTKVVESSKKAQAGIVQESSSKRVGDKIKQESSKKQKIKDGNESAELKRCLEIVPNDRDKVTINATPLSSKSPTIVDYKIYKEGRKIFFQIFRADGNSQMYLTFSKLLKNFDREDLEVLWRLVKDRFVKIKLVDDMDSFMLHTLKTMFEHHVEDTVWKNQQLK
nr:hypothetical protein [Tanacetum cinerariifolium]